MYYSDSFQEEPGHLQLQQPPVTTNPPLSPSSNPSPSPQQQPMTHPNNRLTRAHRRQKNRLLEMGLKNRLLRRHLIQPRPPQIYVVATVMGLFLKGLADDCCDAVMGLFLRWGKRFKHGRRGVKMSLEKALDSFLKGAARGSTLAMADAGLVYWEMGRKEEGVALYRKAAELGDPASQCNLGISYLQGGLCSCS